MSEARQDTAEGQRSPVCTECGEYTDTGAECSECGAERVADVRYEITAFIGHRLDVEACPSCGNTRTTNHAVAMQTAKHSRPFVTTCSCGMRLRCSPRLPATLPKGAA